MRRKVLEIKMSASGLPFDDFRELLRNLPGPDSSALAVARERDSQLTKPSGSLGRLEEIAFWLAAWTGRSPQVTRPLVAIFAGNHGVTAQGVSPFPPSVTAQMVENFAAGGAAINQICVANDLGLKIFDLALEGIGNTTIAAAIFYALYGGSAVDWVGPGTGAEGDVLARKIAAVETAVALHKSHLDDPFEVLRRLGGREIAAMAGAILAARMERIPVLIDGYVATAAAAVLHAANPSALDHCLIGHVSAEPGHMAAIEKLGKTPLLALGMRLGEGTGAALAAGIVKSAAQCHSGMATFSQAGVAGRE
jgi:nicotinate-nucleotide--dimethylbenzimidazole phosphoribosyltransferase